MKKNYILKVVFTFLILSTMLTHAQTYNLNSSGTGICSNPGIDADFICAYDGSSAVSLGVFTDTNTLGAELSAMSLVIYGACSGNVEFFINGTSIYTGVASGLGCSCQAISTDPNLPQYYTVTMTPAIVTAYVVGGDNTLSVSVSGSQCFYGADVTVATGGALSVDDFEFNDIKVYPNPTSNIITVTGLIKTESYRIYNVLGGEIKNGLIGNNEEIDIENFSLGFYILEFENGKAMRILKE